jgi:hypothetical protein
MSKEMIDKLETKISELEGKLKQNNDVIGNLILNIEFQSNEKSRIQDESKVLTGAIQAFKSVISELKNSDITEIEEIKEDQ